jgi:hypothetical protein
LACTKICEALSIPTISSGRDLFLEQTDDMAGVEGRSDGDDRARLGDLGRGRQHRGAAQAVADEDGRRLLRLAQMIGGGHEVGDVRGEMRVGEFAFTGAQPGKIETQRGDAMYRQPLGDALGRADVLAAGEAMREQRIGDRLPQGQVEHGRQLFAFGVGKIEPFAAHG